MVEKGWTGGAGDSDMIERAQMYSSKSERAAVSIDLRGRGNVAYECAGSTGEAQMGTDTPNGVGG